MTHPSNIELANFLDMPADTPQYAELRAHILTCNQCAAHVARLRADSERIGRALELSPAPTGRSIRLPRRGWQYSGAALQLMLLVGILLLGVILFLQVVPRPQTAQQQPGRLYVTDSASMQLLVLNAANGNRLETIDLGGHPDALVYDADPKRMYVQLQQGVALVDLQAASVLQRWNAPDRLIPQSIALDQQQQRLYLGMPGRIVILGLDGPALHELGSVFVGPQPASLALSADGKTLYAADQQEFTIWRIDLASGSAFARLLDRDDAMRHVLAVSHTGLYALSAGAARPIQPRLWQLDPNSLEPRASIVLEGETAAWDMRVLPDKTLAIARGDGYRGGITLIDSQSLEVMQIIDPEHDQHSLASGPSGQLIAMNWLHNTIRAYRISDGSLLWQHIMPGVEPRAAVLVP